MIQLENVSRTFAAKSGQVTALDSVSLELPERELVMIYGPSGCGKTTLLFAIGGMLRPTSGTVRVVGEDLYAMGSGARADFRARHIGFVFQMFHLVPYLTVLDNVLLSTHGTRLAGEDSREAALGLLERLSLGHRVSHRPDQLSTGERQRAAIARATLCRPKVLLADEPTGNLDEENAAEVYRILQDYRDQGGTVLVVTHGSESRQYADRIVEMRAGKISAATETATASS
ncbi:MAG: ABC transporter ATP-binding protein [Planctomycetota bacterium]|nr:MAG: ABC transporter ATP-binding protein [Planctomycetota bacterium]